MTVAAALLVLLQTAQCGVDDEVDALGTAVEGGVDAVLREMQALSVVNVGEPTRAAHPAL